MLLEAGADGGRRLGILDAQAAAPQLLGVDGRAGEEAPRDGGQGNGEHEGNQQVVLLRHLDDEDNAGNRRTGGAGEHGPHPHDPEDRGGLGAVRRHDHAEACSQHAADEQ